MFGSIFHGPNNTVNRNREKLSPKEKEGKSFFWFSHEAGSCRPTCHSSHLSFLLPSPHLTWIQGVHWPTLCSPRALLGNSVCICAGSWLFNLVCLSQKTCGRSQGHRDTVKSAEPHKRWKINSIRVRHLIYHQAFWQVRCYLV